MINKYKNKCDQLWGDSDRDWVWFDYNDIDQIIVMGEEEYSFFYFLYENKLFELAFKFSEYVGGWEKDYLLENDDSVHYNF